jgi:hypothetical protein
LRFLARLLLVVFVLVVVGLGIAARILQSPAICRALYIIIPR